VQAIFNSIFYPTLNQPGVVSGYLAGVDQWLSYVRPLPQGSTNKLVDTEWWAYSPAAVGGWYPVGGSEGSLQAVADVLGWIVHCQNADRWQFNAIEYHAVNVCEGRNPDAQGRPTQALLPDAYFYSYNSKIWRFGRYYALRDIICPCANNYPRLVHCLVQGPTSPASPRNNSPGTQIQACAGLSADGSALAVCLANIGDSRQTVTLSLGRAAAQPAWAHVIPPVLGVETPLTQLAPPFDDGSRQSVTLTVEGYSAVLVEIPL
jgi:hypothetical protein